MLKIVLRLAVVQIVLVLFVHVEPVLARTVNVILVLVEARVAK